VKGSGADELRCDRVGDLAQRHHTDDDREQRDAFHEGRGQDHVDEDAAGHFRLAGDGLHGAAADAADADAGADQRDRGKACADQFCCFWFHRSSAVANTPPITMENAATQLRNFLSIVIS